MTSLVKTALLASVIVLLGLESDIARAQSRLNAPRSPGGVYVYKNDRWQIARPSDVDYAANTYVYIHGAYGKAGKDDVSKFATAALKHDKNANFLAVDWSYWAGLNENKLKALTKERVKTFVREAAARTLDSNGWPDYEEIELRHWTALMTRLAANVLPIEQTNEIPVVADRADLLLFGEKGTTLSFTTDGRKERFVALGLAPNRVALFGHSHGAHICGLVGMKHKNGRARSEIRHITALDPSNPVLHKSKENREGKGWDKTAAKSVVVLRTTELCSSERIYGDLNVYLRNPKHPIFRLDDAESIDKAASILVQAVAEDIRLHSLGVDFLREWFENCNDDEFEEFFDDRPNNGKESRWNIEDLTL